MRLITLQRFAEKYFEEESRPNLQNLRRWIQTGKLAGRKVGGTWYIDELEWLADGDPIVLSVLRSSERGR